ncbi:MAG: 50S ribosomal protein L24 [Candidatus Eisenbacteria bacterium]|nr:50S ribosomal protein L24 [Candidatus Latescibacterota bacterium]MBD3301964.1 50S ribosomal protein L24 [Candidatus Eisenbacteria bacterium]
MKIRRGDKVIVIKGADKGKIGKVLSVDPVKRVVYVQRVRLVKRHQKPRPTQTGRGPSTGIVEKEAPIPVANVALVDPKTDKPTRIRMSRPEAEDRTSRRRAKVRLAVRSGVEIERPGE